MTQSVHCNRKETKMTLITISQFEGGINGRKVWCWFHLLFHPSASVPPPFACRTGGPRGEWRVWGDHHSLPPSLLSPVLSALQSPLSTLITYINVSKKRTTLWVGLCVR